MTVGIAAGGNELPYRWRPSSYEIDGKKGYNERAIATQQTGFWFVGQCRNWLPDEIGGLFWFAVDDAGTAPLSPFYACSDAISEHYAHGNGSMLEYSPTSMFWLQNRIAQFAYLRYNHIGKEVRENVDAHELAMVDAVATADARAYELQSPQERREYLTRFSVSQANELFKKWKALDEYLLVKFIDGNTKHQNPDARSRTTATPTVSRRNRCSRATLTPTRGPWQNRRDTQKDRRLENSNLPLFYHRTETSTSDVTSFKSGL